MGMTRHPSDHTIPPNANFPSAPRIAVTGFQGFLGQRLVRCLLHRGVQSILVEGDVRQAETWSVDFDVVVHLAAALPPVFVDNPAEGFSVNLGGLVNALEACRKRGASLVFASTCGVYVPSTSGAVSEDHPVDARTPYAASKLMGEMLCSSFANHYHVPCRVLRLFNVFGSGQQEPSVIPYLLRCAAEGETARVRHPDSVRDYVHVDDVIEALTRAVVVPPGYSVINIGSGRAYSVRQVIELVGRVLGKPLDWTSVTATEDPHPAIWADIRRAKDCLGWTPRMEFLDGLTEAAAPFLTKPTR
jgi:UDP-glucose 4-epimerase